MKDEFSLHYIDKTWKVIHHSPPIYYKTKQSETFGFEVPYSDSDLLAWYKEQVGGGGELIPCVNLFLNNERLSTQVPMHHVYYTDNIELECLNEALQTTTVKFTEEFYDIKRLQSIIKEE
jgi:hypothetical protein